MDVIYADAALKQIAAMPKADAKRIRAALQQVADSHPERPGFVTQLVGEANTWRLRKGDWRAIYYVLGGTMTVTKVAKRGEVYR